MPDAITPVGTMYPPQNPIAALSSIYGIQQQQVNLAQQKQALQTGQYQQQTAQAQSQQAQQQNTELQGLSTFAKNASKDPSYQLPDGSLDTQKFTNGALAVAPVYGPEHIGQVVSMAKESVATRKAVQDLSSEQNAQLGNSLAGLATNKDAKWSDVLDVIGQQRANNPNPEYGRALDNIQGHIDKQDIQGSAQKMMSALKGVLNVSPSTVETPTNIYPGTTNIFSGQFNPSGQNVPKNMPQQAVTYPNKQLGTMGGPSSGGALNSNFFTPQAAVRGAYGGPPPNFGGGGQAPPQAPAPQHAGRAGNTVLTAANDPNRPDRNAPGAAQESWNQSVQKAQQDVQGARDTDNNYGNSMAVASEIRKLSAETDTGPGSEKFKNVVGAITSRFGGSQGVTNTQTLESFLDRQAANFRDGMDLPKTNAGVEQARAIGGNIGMQGGAIQAKNSYNEALAQGLHDYRTGLDHVEGFTGNPSPTAVNKFKGAWSQNFDPLAYQWKLAMQRGDKQSANAITSSMSPADRQALQQKGRNLDLLSQGKLP